MEDQTLPAWGQTLYSGAAGQGGRAACPRPCKGPRRARTPPGRRRAVRHTASRRVSEPAGPRLRRPKTSCDQSESRLCTLQPMRPAHLMRESAILATILMSMKSGLPCDDDDDCLRADDDLVEDDPPAASGSIIKASFSEFSSR